MAPILGGHLVISMVSASILQKLSARVSFTSWFLCNRLFVYLHPTDEVLRGAIGSKDEKVTRKKYRRKDGENDVQQTSAVFSIQKQAHDLTSLLERVALQPRDLASLQFANDLQWMLEFSLAVFAVFLASALYIWLLPAVAKSEMNLSIIWIAILGALAFKNLVSLAAQTFSGHEMRGEQSIIFTSGAICAILAMFLLLLQDDVLELNLTQAFDGLMTGVAGYINTTEITSANFVMENDKSFRLCLGFIAGLLGGVMTLPSFRLSKCHIDSVTYSKGNPGKQALLHVHAIAPLLASLSWSSYLGRRLYTEAVGQLVSVRGCPEWLILWFQQDNTFDLLRILFTLVPCCLLRFWLLPVYLQAYLNLAHSKVRALKNEAGTITNVQLQKMVARIFYYMTAVALQLLAPACVLLSSTLILYSLGQQTDSTGFTLFWRGLLNFVSFWVCSVQFLLMMAGVIYHKYALQ